MCGTKAEPSCWEHVRVPSSRNNRSPAGVKSGENLSIFPTFAQLGVNGRREPDFFDKLKRAAVYGRPLRFVVHFYFGSREVSHQTARSMESFELPQSASSPVLR